MLHRSPSCLTGGASRLAPDHLVGSPRGTENGETDFGVFRALNPAKQEIPLGVRSP